MPPVCAIETCEVHSIGAKPVMKIPPYIVNMPVFSFFNNNHIWKLNVNTKLDTLYVIGFIRGPTKNRERENREKGNERVKERVKK